MLRHPSQRGSVPRRAALSSGLRVLRALLGVDGESPLTHSPNPGPVLERILTNRKAKRMRKSRFSEAQIVVVLKQAEAGVPIAS